MQRQHSFSWITLVAFALTLRPLTEGHGVVPRATTTTPQCATECFLQNIDRIPCQLTDIHCLCTNPQLADITGPCVQSNCSIEEQLQAAKVQVELCELPTHDDSYMLAVLGWTMFSFAAITVLMRFMVRLLIEGGLGWDDATILLCFLLDAAATGIDHVLHARFGMGQDFWMLSPYQITNFLKYLLIYEMIFSWVINLVKISILFFYLRIFTTATGNPGLRVTIYTIMAVIMVYNLACFFIMAFVCRPLSYAWTQWDGAHTGTCLNYDKAMFSTVISGPVLDAIVIALPVNSLRKMTMTRTNKILVGLMFGVGIIATGCSIGRVVAFVQFTKNRVNPTYAWRSTQIWNDLELNLSIICACLPALRRMYTQTRISWSNMSQSNVFSYAKSYKYRSRNESTQSVEMVFGSKSSQSGRSG